MLGLCRATQFRPDGQALARCSSLSDSQRAVSATLSEAATRQRLPELSERLGITRDHALSVAFFWNDGARPWSMDMRTANLGGSGNLTTRNHQSIESPF